MEPTDQPDLDVLLDDLAPEASDSPADAIERPRRDPMQLLAKIPVQLTLEVGSATITLAELMAIEEGSVLELDRLAGEPLLIKINGTPVGHAEVVVSGDNYGLKLLDLEQLGDFAP
ncbi:flagellar motor switch protein FliN [Burkholderia oklahomensis]|uniref:Flagellar motor switch protein FliN n=1 Tax=Burkholderia oklahomensis TaxID=342113 RepID=A0AAI8BAL1_9BURK|nr:flagellar motor switch protein FliN [Burkholderia oklahomensis]AIO68633.1 flagellar motor switch protein FliN [Burkholderia oklahomensis]AJX35918.1 flagellar motor switch protein FliN [Burkholderia oklahomensis C6786]AOI38233.1 flagellar motor switch protein FliN [Burkholderia oklahomensis EO147]AOI47956.1 flagellar motor switch protein FliN [Burkholderia oklahomensis C6786]KUY48642.1 flagellar motor switch protein FliN [Burkholderia oklahomensis EO147]